MEDFVTRREYEEHSKRMEDEHRRQNDRIGQMEEIARQNNKLLAAVERLAISVENMQKELNEQGEQLETLKSRDGEMWRKVVGYIITTLVGIVIGYICVQIGL